MKILFLIPYPLYESPSQRFRFEQYIKTLDERGYAFSFQSFLDSHNWQLFFKSGKNINKFFALVKGYFKRISILLKVSSFDLIFIHREVTPLGPPLFEWIIAKLFRKKIIYDFDDAIWLTDKRNESSLMKTIKWRGKVASICKWSHKVSCGNDYLCSYAKKYNLNTFYIPTTIDTLHLHNPKLYKQITSSKNNNRVIVGWTGSHSTIKYLYEIEPVLQNLEKKFSQLEFWVIADKSPQLELKCFRFKPWSLENEIVDLAEFDIGIMPLPDDEWVKGKCGFKILQYMALQIPAIASPVGVNNQIIQSGLNGYLCDSMKSWEDHLKELIENTALRNSIGIQARKTVLERYSVLANKDNFISLLK